MKLQVVMEDRLPLLRRFFDFGRVCDEIIGIVPFRDKIIIATRSRLLLLEHDEETEILIKEIVQRHHDELWPEI